LYLVVLSFVATLVLAPTVRAQDLLSGAGPLPMEMHERMHQMMPEMPVEMHERMHQMMAGMAGMMPIVMPDTGVSPELSLVLLTATVLVGFGLVSRLAVWRRL
jgi:hypothetical protein